MIEWWQWILLIASRGELVVSRRFCYSFFCLFLIFSFIFFANSSEAESGAEVRTLLIGDSHTVGSFGASLVQMIRSQGSQEKVARYGYTGASPRHYTSEDEKNRTLKLDYVEDVSEEHTAKISPGPVVLPQLSEIISKNKPNRIIIELGENLYSYQENDTSYSINKKLKSAEKSWKKEVDDLLQTIPTGSPCVWVLPTWTNKANQHPYFKSNDRLKKANLMMKKLIGNRCQVISGTELPELTPETVQTAEKDYLHHTKESGHLWATAVFNKIEAANQKNGSKVVNFGTSQPREPIPATSQSQK